MGKSSRENGGDWQNQSKLQEKDCSMGSWKRNERSVSNIPFSFLFCYFIYSPYSLNLFSKARQSKQGMPWGWTIARVAVFDKVKATLGLDRAHFLATAAAPMPEETSDFFMSLNIPICDVYALPVYCSVIRS